MVDKVVLSGMADLLISGNCFCRSGGGLPHFLPTVELRGGVGLQGMDLTLGMPFIEKKNSLFFPEGGVVFQT